MKLIACLALVSAPALSAPLDPAKIAAMQAQSEYVMSAGLCAVANDSTDYKAQTVLILLPAPIGARRVLKNDFNWLRNAGYAKAPSGRYLMTERIGEACAEAESGRCLAARVLWQQTWAGVQNPTRKP